MAALLAPPAAAAGSPSALAVAINGEINPALATFLVAQVKRAEAENRPALIIRLDTPGGRVDSALAMSDALINSTVPTLAIVTNAFSAGALIALSCQQVIMLPGSEIGAALPISSSGEAIPGLVGKKINSALAAKFRSVAETRGRPADLAEAMVNPDKVIPGLNAKGNILTLTAADAVKYKMADFAAKNGPDALVQGGFGALAVEEAAPGPAVALGAFLTDPIVAAILLAIGLVGLGIELLHPGVAFPGLIGGLALAAYFGGSFLAGHASSVAFLLFVAGLLLLAAEVAVIPGFGLAGLAGLGSIAASIYLSYPEQFPNVAGLAVVLAGIGMGLALWLLPSSRLTRRITLGESLAGNKASNPELARLVDSHGAALTDLRPTGVADLDGERVDVITNGEFVERGAILIVERVEGRRVVVRRMDTLPNKQRE